MAVYSRSGKLLIATRLKGSVLREVRVMGGEVFTLYDDNGYRSHHYTLNTGDYIVIDSMNRLVSDWESETYGSL